MDQPTREPDLEKMRRFALFSGLLVFAYFLALVQPKPPVEFDIFGTKVSLSVPLAIPFTLLLASIYSALRYAYYAIFIERAPWQVRRQFLQSAQRQGESDLYAYGLAPNSDAAPFVKELAAVFPLVDRLREGVRVSERPHPNNGSYVRVEFRLPWYVRALAIFQDIDYAAPIWVNVAAVCVAMVRLWAA